MRCLLPIAALLLLSTAAQADDGMAGMAMSAPAGVQPKESGQSAFAAIHEIVDMLEADPHTDWSKVNIDALRTHLVDMDNVTLRAQVAYTPIANGERIHVSGNGDVRQSIQHMVAMHAGMAGDTPDWRMTAANTPDGVDLVVTAKSAAGLRKMKALGFFGMLADGSHHARHHMMLARGTM